MHIASPAGQQLRQRNIGTPQAQAQNEWHQEFARQTGGNATGVASYQQPIHGHGMQNGYAPMNSGMYLGQGDFMGGGFTGGIVNPQPAFSAAQPIFDEEAFARAFEEAEQAELATLQTSPEQAETEVTTEQTEQIEQVTGLDDNVLLPESAERLMESSNLDQAPMGADYILPQSQKDRNKHNHDDLARTAGQLLTHLRDDTSDKFQQSKFLNLMRMLRDKEVVVVDEQIVDKGSLEADLEGDAERAVGVVKGAEEVVPVQA